MSSDQFEGQGRGVLSILFHIVPQVYIYREEEGQEHLSLDQEERKQFPCTLQSLSPS